ncbi:LPS-assembly lipoprotein LptE [Luteimonas notoginsengisoli]|uniref:LPS-assembly lipoprotein LptE n=1 Tax=Luteimonas notoginsengisoli TaxID=1578200 RepID=A0ABV7URI1_9GAMM
MTRLIALLVLALGLTACGFHLRSALTLPPDLGPVRVVARDPYSPLAESLAVALEQAGATPAPEAADGDVATLRIRLEKWGSTPISIDQFGRAQEYTLRYAVMFSLDKADGTNVVPQQTVELARDYVSVPTRSTGTEGERELLAREMQKEMTASILRRIDAASRAPMPIGMPDASPTPVDGTVPPAEPVLLDEPAVPEAPAAEPATTP